MPRRIHDALYVLQLTLLATHQVDASYWHEWDVFGVPGGIEMFLVFHFFAVLALAAGLCAVAARHPLARLCVFGCALTGTLTAGIHAVFLAIDRTAFWAPLSLGVLLAILATSIVQAAVAHRAPMRDEGTAVTTER